MTKITAIRRLISMSAILMAGAASAGFVPGGFSPIAPSTKGILSDVALLRRAGIPLTYGEPNSKVGYAIVTPEQEEKLSQLAHAYGRCGGYEAIDNGNPSFAANNARQSLAQLRMMEARSFSYNQMRVRQVRVAPNPTIQTAITQLSSQALLKWVQWISNFPTRYNRESDPNVHVRALVAQLNSLTLHAAMPMKVDVVNHQSTKQQSIRVHIDGAKRPQEIVVLGGHFDSINMNGSRAPGADDNASGSANLLEVLRVILAGQRPDRSVEFFWYAGEESGLLGSAEIAKTYRANKVQVVGVLQLDMTSYPGAGAGVIGLMTDYTHPWMRDYLTGLNSAYVGAKFVEDQCGYGCSDHASWFRQGYPAVIPFEATMNTMNHNIHTSQDVISPKINYEHSLLFSKLALAFALDLANSTVTAPN